MKKSTIFVTVLAILLTIADTVIKQTMLSTSSNTIKPILGQILGIALHKNEGVIANIPIPMIIVQLATVLILVTLAYWLRRAWKTQHMLVVNSLIVLILGAIGNLIDRVVHGFTTDYILIFGISVLNIADIMIVVGVAGLLFPQKK